MYFTPILSFSSQLEKKQQKITASSRQRPRFLRIFLQPAALGLFMSIFSITIVFASLHKFLL